MFKKIKTVIGVFVKLIQNAIIFISLFLLYMVGFGIVAIFLAIFNRRLLIQNNNADSFWITANEYEEEFKERLRQS